MSKWAEGTVVDNRHWTEQLYSLRVRAEIEPFVADQFTRLALDLDGERVARPYSYVNAPHEQTLEFYSIVVPGGPLSGRLARLTSGDRVYVAPRASGLLTLDQIGDAESLWLLATGTGLGPFLSILKSGAAWARFARIVLAHAVRHGAELAYRDRIEALLAARPQQLSYVPFVSRERCAFALPGRIPAAIESGALETRCGSRLAPGVAQVMICGNPRMVSDTTATLEARGLRLNKRREPGEISVENYWKAN